MPRNLREAYATALQDGAVRGREELECRGCQSHAEGAAPALAKATDPKGRMALHIACAVKPGGDNLGEPKASRPSRPLLEGGAALEAAGADGARPKSDFRATPLWYAVSRGENLPLVRFLG